MIATLIDSVRVNLETEQRVVILKTLNEDRHLFIWIGSAETYAIASQLQGKGVIRPLSHDLTKSIVEAIGCKVAHVTVSDCIDAIFKSQIILDDAGQRITVDARPSGEPSQSE